MTPADRIKILELSKPSLVNPDVTLWLAIASKLEAWVNRSGHSDQDPHTTAPKVLPQARTTVPSNGPAPRK